MCCDQLSPSGRSSRSRLVCTMDWCTARLHSRVGGPTHLIHGTCRLGPPTPAVGHVGHGRGELCATSACRPLGSAWSWGTTSCAQPRRRACSHRLLPTDGGRSAFRAPRRRRRLGNSGGVQFSRPGARTPGPKNLRSEGGCAVATPVTAVGRSLAVGRCAARMSCRERLLARWLKQRLGAPGRSPRKEAPAMALHGRTDVGRDDDARSLTLAIADATRVVRPCVPCASRHKL